MTGAEITNLINVCDLAWALITSFRCHDRIAVRDMVDTIHTTMGVWREGGSAPQSF